MGWIRGLFKGKVARKLPRRPADLETVEQEDVAAFCQLHSSLKTTYELAQDFLQMMRTREGERLDNWLTQVNESQIPELQSFAHGVGQDKQAVRAGLTLSLNNGHVTKIKLIKHMVYGRATFPFLRQRVLQAL